MHTRTQTSGPLATLALAILIALSVALFAGHLIGNKLEGATQALEEITCEQWGGRFADPCSSR